MHNRMAAIATCIAALAMGTEAQTAVQRDQQALTILSQTIAVGGGQQLLTSIQDLTETGTITYGWGDQPMVDVTVKGRGLHQFKIEADLSKGKRSSVVSGGGGWLKEADGRNWPIYHQSAADLESLTLPYLPLIAAIGDSSTSIVYGGIVTHANAPAYDIRLQRNHTKEQDPSGNLGTREARDFFIDPKTLLVVAISDRIYFGGPTDDGVPHEILYSNYQPESGIMAPLTIAETVRDATGYTMTLSQVTFNSGLADSDFTW